MAESTSPPYNFSWVVHNRLAAMGWPQTAANVSYIVNQRITHLITLSPEMLPPTLTFSQLQWTLIPVQEFDAPSLDQTIQFISICEQATGHSEAVGIHCRMGRGRTGVMAACYLVRFQNLSPDRAVTLIRMMRPGSVETYSQEKAVNAFYDHLMSSKQ